MNIPASLEAVAVVVLLFIPGYIFLQFTREAVAFVPQSADARYFFAVITWGGIIHLLFFAWTQRLLDWYLAKSLASHEIEVALWAMCALIAAPLMLGLAGSWAIKQKVVDDLLAKIGMDYVSRTPSAWNYATKLGARWLRVHLKDGTIIGGVYDESAFADDTVEQDLFLSEVYNLDEHGDFGDPVAASAGIWIAHDEISHIMFYFPNSERSATNDR